MIPKFPEFKILELSDQGDIEKITSQFPPYSDFNFTSLWVWDTKGGYRISKLDDSLVIRFTDYITDEFIYSFIGNEKENETAEALLQYLQKENLKTVLWFIPKEIGRKITKTKFHIESNRNSYDYIYSVEHLAHMNHWTKNTSGKNIRSLMKKNINYIVKHQSIRETQKSELTKIFQKWAGNKGIENHLKLNEYQAFERIFEIKNKKINSILIYINDVLVGFTIYEIVSKDYAISHFAKSDSEHHRAMGDILNWEEAKILNARGIKYFNWEQDLGIPGLRKSKEKYKPIFFLTKFSITKNRSISLAYQK